MTRRSSGSDPDNIETKPPLIRHCRKKPPRPLKLKDHNDPSLTLEQVGDLIRMAHQRELTNVHFQALKANADKLLEPEQEIICPFVVVPDRGWEEMIGRCWLLTAGHALVRPRRFSIEGALPLLFEGRLRSPETPETSLAGFKRLVGRDGFDLYTCQHLLALCAMRPQLVSEYRNIAVLGDAVSGRDGKISIVQVARGSGVYLQEELVDSGNLPTDLHYLVGPPGIPV